MADRVRNALSAFPEARNIVVAGGVAANQEIRSSIKAVAQEGGLPLFVPPVRYCTDNAVMIAWAAWQKRRAHPATDINDLNVAPVQDGRWMTSVPTLPRQAEAVTTQRWETGLAFEHAFRQKSVSVRRGDRAV